MSYGNRKQHNRGGGGSRNNQRYFHVSNNNEHSYKETNHERPNFHRSDRGKNTPGKRREYPNYDQDTKGHGMDKESSMYFEIVFERMHEPFEDDEERDVFVENVVEQMQGKEINVVMSSLGSKTVQKILELNRSFTVIEKLMGAFQSEIEMLSSSQFSSLALQSLLRNCLNYLSTDQVAKEKITAFVVSTAEFCISVFPDIIDHPYQNYILKTIIHVLSGNTVFSFKRNQFECQPVFVEVPDEFQGTFEKLSISVLSLERIEECLQIDLFSFVVQHLLKASSHFPTIAGQIAKNILGVLTKLECSEDQLHPFLTGPSTSHLLEAAIEHFDRKMRKLFMRKYILKHFEKVIHHKQANNVLKTLIWKTPTKKAFIKLFDKLEPYFRLIFQLEHDTLLVALADSCLRFDVCQARFVIALKDVLQCTDADGQNYFVLCVLHMLICEQYIQAESENTASVSLNGSLLVQRLLCFSKPIKIAMAIVTMSLDNLKRISCDPKGSHIVDAFMNSKFIGEKSRDKLVERIKEISITLACSPHGSRSVDAIWANASLKQKIMLADSLAKNGEILSSNKFGKFVHKNLALHHFKNRFEEWKQVQATQDKKRKLFKDLVADSEPRQFVKKQRLSNKET